MTAPELSVVIPTFNNLAVLRRCVEAWESHAGDQRIELLVIEDGCTDGTREFLADVTRAPWGADHVRVVHEQDVHEQQCSNRGMNEAAGAVILVWQDDMFVARRWLVAELVATFRANPQLGILGLTRGLDCHPCARPIERWEDLTDWSRLSSTIGPAPLNWCRVQEVDFVIRPWAVRRLTLQQCGALDAAFALSEWDEADLCFRARAAGWLVATHGYERAGAYQHLGSSTLGRTFSDEYKAQVLRNGLLFHERWDAEIARTHGRERRSWWRRASLEGWRDTAAAALRRLPDRVAGR